MCTMRTYFIPEMRKNIWKNTRKLSCCYNHNRSYMHTLTMQQGLAPHLGKKRVYNFGLFLCPFGGNSDLAEFCRMHLYLLHFYWLSGLYIRVHLRGHSRDINIPTIPLSFNQPHHWLAHPPSPSGVSLTCIVFWQGCGDNSVLILDSTIGHLAFLSLIFWQ